MTEYFCDSDTLFGSPAPSRFPCEPLDDVTAITFGVDEPATVQIPAADGTSDVVSDCGKWRGQICISRSISGVRWMEWIRMFWLETP